MPAELNGHCRNGAVTMRSPQNFKENEAAEISVGTCICYVTTALLLLLAHVNYMALQNSVNLSAKSM